MDKRKIVRYLLITLSVILGVLVFLSITGTVAHAAGLVDNTVSDANTYSKYPLENYQLDFYVDSSWDWLPWNWLDGIGKSIQYGLYAITNFVWTVSLYISNATGYVVQEAYKLDFISDTASSIGKNIQTLAGVTSNGFSSEGFYVGFLLILILQSMEVQVSDDQLSKALKCLPERKRNIILLSYFMDMSDAEIGELMNVVRTTVYRHRTSTLEDLRKMMEEE